MDISNPFAGLGDSSSSVATLEPAAQPTKPAETPAPSPSTSPKATTQRRTASKKPLYIDIETIPDDSRIESFELEPLPEVGPRTPAADMMEIESARSGGVDDIKQLLQSRRPDDEWLDQFEAAERADTTPRKGQRKGVFDAIADLRSEANRIADALSARQKKMSCDAEMCRIVALGWAVGNEPASSIVVGQMKADGSREWTETDLLEKFWQLVSAYSPIVGFNICGFDLPVLFVRSMILKVDASRLIDLTPWKADVVDLMQARFPRQQAKGLKKLAALLGIPVPAEGVDGSQVAELYRTDPTKVGEYVRSDIDVTRNLHQKFRGFFCQ